MSEMTYPRAVQLVGGGAGFEPRSVGFQSCFSSAVMKEPLRSSFRLLRYSSKWIGSLVSQPTPIRRGSFAGCRDVSRGRHIAIDQGA